MTTYVALLRGVNVGGKGIVSMQSVKAGFEGLGYRNVVTYINSGNVVFRAKTSDPRRLEREIEAILPCRVVVKSRAEFEKVLAAAPPDWGGDKAVRYYVMFLRHTVDSEAILKSLKPKVEVEQVIYCPGALLWSVAFQDVGRSGVAKVSREPVYQEMTVRNWNTVRNLGELVQGV